MRQFLFGLSISVAFIVGSLSSQIIHHAVPPAVANPATPAVPRWEYYCQPDVNRPWKPEDRERLNSMGHQGWELVQQLVGNQGVNGDVFCFRRPWSPAVSLPPPPPPIEVKPCAPAGGTGHICEDGKCVDLCRPACGDSQYCASDGHCYWIRNGRRTADMVTNR